MELIRVVIPYALISYGGPYAHVALFEEKFVTDLKWIKKQEFDELFAICASIPGPISAKLIIAIGSIVTRSTRGGLTAFLIFSVPSAVVLMFFGMLVKIADEKKFHKPLWIRLLLHGF
jgi:chromate transporter